MKTFDILKNGLANIPGIDNNRDRFLYPNSRGSFERVQGIMGIPANERIVFVREQENKRQLYSAITDKGIYSVDVPNFFNSLKNSDWANIRKHVRSIKFRDISEVKFSRQSFCFQFSDGSEISRDALVGLLMSDYCFEVAKVLTNAIQSVYDIDHFAKGLALMREHNEKSALVEFEAALEEESKYPDFSGSDRCAEIYYYMAKCHVLLDKGKEAQSYLVFAKDIVSKSKDSKIKDDLMPKILETFADANQNKLESRNHLTEAIELAKDISTKKMLFNRMKELYQSKRFRDAFDALDNLPERKVMLVIKDNLIPVHSRSIICLDRSTIREVGISFPIGHPIDGHVYLAHPTRGRYYIPADTYEEAIFLERVNEYCYLLQALGAKEIKIQTVKGKSVDEMRESKRNAEASVGVGAFHADGNMKSNNSKHSTADQSYSFKNYQLFTPQKKPYVPKDLNWVAIEPKWRRLIDNRLNNTLIEYVEEISTSENKMLSATEELSVNIELKTLFTKLKGTLNIEESITSSSKETTTWSISVKF